jgi:hypothetical protein
MTSHEFVIWLKGVIVGAAKYQPTSEQWKAIRDQIELVDNIPPTQKTIKQLLTENPIPNPNLTLPLPEAPKTMYYTTNTNQ